MTHAPIAIFVYKRPAHARRLIASLLTNSEASASRVYVYSDGPKSDADADLVEATRRTVKDLRIPLLELVERPGNVGLARNIIEGVSAVASEHGRVIVLEDDLVLSPTFLAFMNSALERYAAEPSVMHVSGYMFPIRLPAATDAVFLPFINVSGWGTWSRAWRHFDPVATGYGALCADEALRRRFDLEGHYYFFQMLEQYRAGRSDSWAVRWYLSMFMRRGLAVFPARSLVENRGYDPAGTNTTDVAPPHGRAVAQPFRAGALPDAWIDPVLFDRVRRLMSVETSLSYRAKRKLLRVWRRVSADVTRRTARWSATVAVRR